MPFKSYREESRANWGRTLCDEQHPSNEEVQLGAILRIADAAEVMARNHQQLINERDRLLRRIAALRGHITRLKKGMKK